MSSGPALLVGLRKSVASNGYDKRAFADYLPALLITNAVIVACWAVLPALAGQWLLLAPLALIFSLALGQAGLIAHDASHRQLSQSRRINRFVAKFQLCMMLGASETWWREKHDAHHANPNVFGVDPDLNPILQSLLKGEPASNAFGEWGRRHPAALFLPVLFLQAVLIRIDSVLFLLKDKRRELHLERVMVAVHNVLALAWPLAVLGIVDGLLFYALYHALLGTYLGLIFAPNHIGCRTLTEAEVIDPLERQVTTSRNIRVPRRLAWLFGGLHLQIEHHVFPNLPSAKLLLLKPQLEAVCKQAGLHYHEVSFWRALVEVVQALRTPSLSGGNAS